MFVMLRRNATFPIQMTYRRPVRPSGSRQMSALGGSVADRPTRAGRCVGGGPSDRPPERKQDGAD